MDDIVKAALAKWPNVPHCYHWLALDARGDWYMRDERIQAAGPFPAVKGSRIQHEKLLAFIHRNYAADAQGAWYFQNGPQRVYLQLQATPFVWRLNPGRCGPEPSVQAHTGQEAGAVLGCWLDEAGRLYLQCSLGYGLVHSLDMEAAANAVEASLWQPQELASTLMPGRFGYVMNPQPGA